MLDSAYNVFVLVCCVRFSPNVVLCIMSKHLHCGRVCLKDLIPEVLWFLANLELYQLVNYPTFLWHKIVCVVTK